LQAGFGARGNQGAWSANRAPQTWRLIWLVNVRLSQYTPLKATTVELTFKVGSWHTSAGKRYVAQRHIAEVGFLKCATQRFIIGTKAD
jgi:hypothetical protein